jgi:CHRD domain
MLVVTRIAHLQFYEDAQVAGALGASGVATIKFESAGTVICIDATIMGFDPALAHIHNAKAGSNGVLLVDFTSTKIAPGRFLDASSCL